VRLVRDATDRDPLTRTAWTLLLLLAASNAVWFTRQPERSGTPAPDAGTYEQTIARLERKVRQMEAATVAEAAAPELVGSAGARAAPPSPEHAPGPTSPAGEVAPPAETAAQGTQRGERTHQEKVLDQVKATLRKVLQVEDAALRREGLAELESGLRSTDPTLVEYSLSALHSMRVEGVDRSVFRGQVLDLLQAEDAGIRRAALYALHSTGVRPDDMRHALAGAHDESPLVRQHVARVLRLYNHGDFTGEAETALVALLADPNRDVRRGTLRAVSDLGITEPVETALLALAKRPEDRQEAVTYGLSRVKDKSRRVIDSLFTYLDDENAHVRQRAHWGLQHGTRSEDAPYVARGYADHLERFLTPKAQQEALRVIARFGDARLMPQVERFADNTLVETRVRALAGKVVEHLRQK